MSVMASVKELKPWKPTIPLIVDGDENARHFAFLVLTGTKMEPLIERGHPARERRAVMLAERLDRFDHARSTEKIAMTFQYFDKT